MENKFNNQSSDIIEENDANQVDIDSASDFDYLRLEDYKGKIKYRRMFVIWTIVLSSVWSAFIFLLVTALGFEWIKLAPTVTIAIISTAFIEVLGLPAIVIHGLFSKNMKSKK